MKIFTVDQLRQADQATLENQSISTGELMERAATLVFHEIHNTLKGAPTPLKIFCGIGDNGGDGLVIGRHLIEHGYNVTIYVVNYSDKRSRNFLLNYDRIKKITRTWPILLTSEVAFPDIHKEDLVIDGIFGVGLNRPVVEWVAGLNRLINKSGAFVIALDVPSGLFANEPSCDKSCIIKADLTYTMQAPKLAFFLPETGGYVGRLQIVNIGLDNEFLSQTEPAAHLIEKSAAKGFYRSRDKFSHKGTFGHALLIGGSYGKMGSISLTATATLRAGAGLATVFVPKSGYTVLQTLLPEAMVLTDAEEGFLSDIHFDLEPSVICFGVGVGQEDKTLSAFENLLDRTDKPMVIDADGLNLLSKKPELLKKVPKNSVLTPHPGELQRLVGPWENDFEKIEKTKKLVEEYHLIVVIKGAHSLTISAGGMYVNNTGNPGMATAGSGDVLAGVITGLISQQYEPLSATILGVYLHGRAGDLAARKNGAESLIAGDIVKNLGNAYLDLFQSPEKQK